MYGDAYFGIAQLMSGERQGPPSRHRPPAEGPKLVLLNKPYGVLTQFSASGSRKTLADYIPYTDVYPAGRLDADSEGLVLLTSNGLLQHWISDPRHKLPKIYWVQVEGMPTPGSLEVLGEGVDLGDFRTLPCCVRTIVEPPGLWARTPPIRERKCISTAWLEIELREGKNRQVRRMTARIGHPTLRLIRYSIGPFRLDGLTPGEWRALAGNDIALCLDTEARRTRPRVPRAENGRERKGRSPE